jgi:hypothetical protein
MSQSEPSFDDWLASLEYDSLQFPEVENSETADDAEVEGHKKFKSGPALRAQVKKLAEAKPVILQIPTANAAASTAEAPEASPPADEPTNTAIGTAPTSTSTCSVLKVPYLRYIFIAFIILLYYHIILLLYYYIILLYNYITTQRRTSILAWSWPDTDY